MNKVFNFPTGSAAQDQGLEFRALSVSVDNPTNQWIYLSNLGVTVPQYTIGATYSLPATSRLQFSYIAPAGQTEPPTIVGQSATITAWDIALPSTAGVGMLGGRAPYYDRNPLSIVKNSSTTKNANSGLTTMWTYTVPAGRRAYLEACQAETTITVLYANDAADLFTAIDVAPLGSGVGDIIMGQIFVGVAAGTTTRAVLGASIELQPTDLIRAIAQDSRAAGAGTAYHLANAKITEFDA